MNAQINLNNTPYLVTLNMHKIRFQAFFACVHSLMNGGAVSVTGIRRGIDFKVYEKHNFKELYPRSHSHSKM